MTSSGLHVPDVKEESSERRNAGDSPSVSVTSLILFSVLLALLALALAAKPSGAHFSAIQSSTLDGNPRTLKWNGSPRIS